MALWQYNYAKYACLDISLKSKNGIRSKCQYFNLVAILVSYFWYNRKNYFIIGHFIKKIVYEVVETEHH